MDRLSKALLAAVLAASVTFALVYVSQPTQEPQNSPLALLGSETAAGVWESTKGFMRRHPALSGAIAGGLAGSTVFPGIGTVIGIATGASVGSTIGSDERSSEKHDRELQGGVTGETKPPHSFSSPEKAP